MKDESSSGIGSVLLMVIQVVLGIGLLWLSFLCLAGWMKKTDREQIDFANKATVRSLLLLLVLVAITFVIGGPVGEPMSIIIISYPVALFLFVVVTLLAKMVEAVLKG
jgi:hypothetical protein